MTKDTSNGLNAIKLARGKYTGGNAKGSLSWLTCLCQS